MAKMTQEMYGAQGRIGNKTYYRAPSGATVARTVVTPASFFYEKVILVIGDFGVVPPAQLSDQRHEQ